MPRLLVAFPLLLAFVACQKSVPQSELFELTSAPASVTDSLWEWLDRAQFGELEPGSPEAQLRRDCHFERRGDALSSLFQYQVGGTQCPVQWNLSRTQRQFSGHRFTEVLWNYTVIRALGPVEAGWSCVGQGMESTVRSGEYLDLRGGYLVDCGNRFWGRGEWKELRKLSSTGLERDRQQNLQVKAGERAFSLFLHEGLVSGNRTLSIHGGGAPVTEREFLQWWNWVGPPLRLLGGQSARNFKSESQWN